jgi:hypothetical protein
MSFRKLVMWAESIVVDPFHVSPAISLPATPVKANNDCCDGTDSCALQQTLPRFSLED